MRELTDAYLRALKPPLSGRIELRDSRVRGLVLRLTANGIATWSVRTRTRDGRQTRPALGTWPTIGIAEARKAALAALVAFQQGADPVAEKRAARVARKAALAEATVADRLAEWQAARRNDRNKGWGERHAAEVSRAIGHDILPRLGKRRLVETTRTDWTTLIAAKRKTAPAMAAGLYRIISAFLGHAEAHGWIGAPLLPRKAGAVLAPTVAARARVLTEDELRAVWITADREAPKLRAFVRLLILTAARESEVANMIIGEIDLEMARWTIPAARAKNGMALTLPLGTLALAELRAIWPSAEAPPALALLGRGGSAGFQGFSRLKERIDAASGVRDWRWHDLRRTARTGMARLGVPRDHAEAAINHISGRSALERTYDRHDYAAEIIAASNRWQAHVAGLIGETGRLVAMDRDQRRA